MTKEEIAQKIFSITNEEQFNKLSLAVMRFQVNNNPIYQSFCNALGFDSSECKHYSEIPFMPIEFFKSHKIYACDTTEEICFTSSGTTGLQTSKHYVKSLALYEESFVRAFKSFFGPPQDYHILALLPSYLEREGSSLIYMTENLIRQSQSRHSGFYLNNLESLQKKIHELRKLPGTPLLLGVSFALLDLAENFPVSHPELIVMETGGMKGKRKELVRDELHNILKKGLTVNHIYSEYGMTELLSQAYSKGEGWFETPPWMKVLLRDTNDPRSFIEEGSGGISVIDLANFYSCSFIATSDLGKKDASGKFSIIGRFDQSDVRGCNLMVE